MKKILVIMMTVMALITSCGIADSGENPAQMEIIIFRWTVDENCDVKLTDVDVVPSTQNACKELMETYEWYYDYVVIGSIHHQKMAHSGLGYTVEVGVASEGELWAFPVFENGEPKPMDLTTIVKDLEVYYNL